MVADVLEDVQKAIQWRKEWEKDQGAALTMAMGRRRRRRQKRSFSRERNVEALVVVDSEMMKYYRDLDVETYILTIMNMVSFSEMKYRMS